VDGQGGWLLAGQVLVRKVGCLDSAAQGWHGGGGFRSPVADPSHLSCPLHLPSCPAQNLLNEPRCKGCPNGTVAAWYDEMARFTKSVSSLGVGWRGAMQSR